MSSSPMSLPPSVKGAALVPLAAAVNELVEAGKLAVTELDAVLSPDEVALLENGIAPSLWYPVECFDHLLMLLSRQTGSSDPAWIARLGRESAPGLFEDGPYASFVEGSRSLGERAGVALVKLSQLLLSFGEWSYAGSAQRAFVLEVRDAEPMSEWLQHAAGGFIEYLAGEMAGRAIEVDSQRLAPDRVLYRGRPAR